MATQWVPMTRMEPRTWLLSSGEIVTEPPLETTTSGRKIRVAGTKESVYSGELDALLNGAVRTMAASKKTTILAELTDQAAHERNVLGFDPKTSKASLHYIHDSGNRWAGTECWWRFKHSDMPFECIMSATINYQGYVSTRLLMPVYYPSSPDTHYLAASSGFENILSIVDTQSFSDLRSKWREFLRDNPPNWNVDLAVVNKANPSGRAAVKALLPLVREIDALASIQVPDLRDIDNPSWMDLDLYETNVNNEFIADLVDFLDGGAAVEQVAELYGQMVDLLRGAGMNLPTKDENDFLVALSGGGKECLQVTIGPLAEEGDGQDGHHRLYLHLGSGTFAVDCRYQASDLNEVAEKWEEAKTIAALTGEEDALLAYAENYSKERGKRRIKKILKERVATGQ